MKLVKGKKITVCLLVFVSLAIAIFAMSGAMLNRQNVRIDTPSSICQQMNSVALDETNDAPPFDKSKITIPNNAKKLNDITLPEGWEWEEPDAKLQKGTQKVWVKYVGEDKDNYTTQRLEIEVTISTKTKATNPWQIVIYAMIPWNLIMTIVYIIHMRKMRFKKKFIEQQEEPPIKE